jgi:hypothetical protein
MYANIGNSHTLASLGGHQYVHDAQIREQHQQGVNPHQPSGWFSGGAYASAGTQNAYYYSVGNTGFQGQFQGVPPGGAPESYSGNVSSLPPGLLRDLTGMEWPGKPGGASVEGAGVRARS